MELASKVVSKLDFPLRQMRIIFIILVSFLLFAASFYFSYIIFQTNKYKIKNLIAEEMKLEKHKKNIQQEYLLEQMFFEKEKIDQFEQKFKFNYSIEYCVTFFFYTTSLLLSLVGASFFKWNHWDCWLGTILLQH